MRKIFSYFRYLKYTAGKFALGTIAGVIYGIFSGLGVPLLVEWVLPIIFGNYEKLLKLPGVVIIFIESKLGPIEFWTTNDQHKFLVICVLSMAGIFFCRSLTNYVNVYFISQSKLIVLKHLRIAVYQKIQSLPFSFFRKRHSGDLVVRILSDTGQLSETLLGTINDLVKQPITLISAISFLVYRAIQETAVSFVLISFATTPLLIILISRLGKRLLNKSRNAKVFEGKITNRVSENLRATIEVRSFNLQAYELEKFKSLTDSYVRESTKAVKYGEVASPLVEFVSVCGFAVSIYLGVQKGLTLESFLALGMALYISYEPLKKLAKVYQVFRIGQASLERMEEILDEPDTLLDPEDPVSFPKEILGMSIQNVSFHYRKEQPILKQVSCEIKKNQVIAFIREEWVG